MKSSTASTIRILLISGVLALIGNFIGFKVSPIEALPGMIILFVLVVGGYFLTRLFRNKLPTIAFVSAIAIIASIPGVPFAEQVVEYCGKVQFLALCTPILAYAGISIGKDLNSFKEQGLKMVIITLLTFLGTFIGSAAIAQVILKMTGVI